MLGQPKLYQQRLMGKVVVRGQAVLQLPRIPASPMGETYARNVLKVKLSVISLTEPQILKKGIQVRADFELALGVVSSFAAAQVILSS